MNRKRTEKKITLQREPFTLLTKMPWKNFLEKEPPSFCSRNEHLLLHKPRGTKTAPHNQLPLFSQHVHCAMALEQHKILQMWEESTNKRHFMVLIPDKPWEVSLLEPSLIIAHQLWIAFSQVTEMCPLQTQISLSLKMATHHLKWSLSMCAEATSIILCPTRPEVCADATREVPASADGHCSGWPRQKSTAVEPLFTVKSFLGKQRVRTVQVTKYLHSRTN